MIKGTLPIQTNGLYTAIAVPSLSAMIDKNLFCGLNAFKGFPPITFSRFLTSTLASLIA